MCFAVSPMETTSDTLPDPPDDDTFDGLLCALRPPDDRVFAAGVVLNGTYRIARLIGRGGMSQVYEADDLVLRRRVAIKVLNRRELGWLLRNEAQVLAATRHPGIVYVYGLGCHDGFDYLVLELLVGATLEERLARRRASGERLSMTRAMDVLVRLTEILVALHAAGVAHRDVKPGNVMLSGERVVLMDLGIGVPEVDVSLMERNTGTPYYMAPEAILGRVAPGKAHLMDLYALGLMAFELLAGRRPYEARDTLELFRLHVSAPVPDLARELPTIPPRLAELVRECMAKNPADRPPSAEAILWELRSFHADESWEPRRRSVLIVDDDEALAALVMTGIRDMSSDVEVEIASDGEEALRRLQRHRPDVMLIDLNMRRMNGVELCMHLRGSEAANGMTIVPMSAEASAGDLAVLRALGMTEFVPKGIGLIEKVQEILTGAGLRLANAPC
jgi:serine/threonine-protein kinase